MFEDSAFVEYLNDPANNIATWHLKGDAPDEYSDCFVTYDGGAGDGSHSNMPEKWWSLIMDLCEAEGLKGSYCIVHITNLEE